MREIHDSERTSVETVAERAIAALQESRAFSAIRLGDGEGRLLAWPGGITRAELDKRLRYWFGHAELSDEEVLTLKVDLLRAVIGADVLGYYRGTERNRWWCEPARAVARMSAFCEEGLHCGNDLHRELWLSGALDRIIAAAECVVLVTCRDVLDAFYERYRRRTCRLFVPEEAHAAGGQRNDHWGQYPAIRERVKGYAGEPGTLVLVGAGVLGKCYCGAAKAAGGVAIDVGSLFDGWAGMRGTRSYLAGGGFEIG